MAEQGQATDSVIHFSCDHCSMSLTVDDSLAGVTGPCPSCGEEITAPRIRGAADFTHSEEPREIEVQPRSMKGRATSAEDKKVQVSSQRPSVHQSRSEGGHRRRSVSPEGAVSETHRERTEVATVAKMLVAGLVVLGIVLCVAYWLNHGLNVQ